ncbi:MAG TPA: CheR family methyltransferase [Mycobacteriales bacterium]|nr:CheR family methyltransferase [Mycobacteriales bacterium]
MKRVALSDSEFATLANLLHSAAGLSFDESRRDSLAFSIAERMRVTKIEDVPSYLDQVGAITGSAELQALLDEVTIPETHFFRNPPQIRALRKYVIPELIRHAERTKRLRIWSAGCSTGEEAYTLAILIRELLPATTDWDVQIIATDISTRSLAAGRAGVYGERAFVMTDEADLNRWFVADPNGGSWKVRDEVRSIVEFVHHNLVTDEPVFVPGEADLILCRNVTIYFDRETTRKLMQRLYNRLRDGGYLFLGHAETLWQISDDFSLVSLGDAFVYRRLDEAAVNTATETIEHRRILPERRTKAESRGGTEERRKPESDRRHKKREKVEVPKLPRLVTPALPIPRVIAPQFETRDPLDTVRIALTEGRYAEAADIAAEVAGATPLRADAHYLWGVALTNLGRDAEALVVLRKTVYLDPEHGFAHFMLGGALDRLGEGVAAARSYRAAAGTLARTQVDRTADELGGRDAAELAALCLTLADRAGSSAGLEGSP